MITNEQREIEREPTKNRMHLKHKVFQKEAHLKCAKIEYYSHKNAISIGEFRRLLLSNEDEVQKSINRLKVTKLVFILTKTMNCFPFILFFFLTKNYVLMRNFRKQQIMSAFCLWRDKHHHIIVTFLFTAVAIVVCL